MFPKILNDMLSTNKIPKGGISNTALVNTYGITLRCPAKHYSNRSKPFLNSPFFGSFYNLQKPSKPRPVLLCMEVALHNWIKQMWGICLAPSTHCGNDKINSNQTAFNRSALKKNKTNHGYEFDSIFGVLYRSNLIDFKKIVFVFLCLDLSFGWYQ